MISPFDHGFLTFLVSQFRTQDAMAGALQYACANGDAPYIAVLQRELGAKDLMDLARIILKGDWRDAAWAPLERKAGTA